MKRPRGYTLIELLVVISVIAVLATMLLPVINMVRERGQRTSCLSNLKQLGTAFVAYSVDEKNRGFFPHEDRDGLALNTAMDLGNYCWFDRLDAYIGTSNLSRCKQCPAWDGAANVDISGETVEMYTYKMNTLLENGIEKGPKTGYSGAWPSEPAAKKYYFFPSHRAKNAGGVVLLFDGRIDLSPYDLDTTGDWTGVDHTRHSGTTNMTFCDGSAKNVEGSVLEPNGWTDEGGIVWDPWK